MTDDVTYTGQPKMRYPLYIANCSINYNYNLEMKTSGSPERININNFILEYIFNLYNHHRKFNL